MLEKKPPQMFKVQRKKHKKRQVMKQAGFASMSDQSNYVPLVGAEDEDGAMLNLDDRNAESDYQSDEGKSNDGDFSDKNRQGGNLREIPEEAEDY